MTTEIERKDVEALMQELEAAGWLPPDAGVAIAVVAYGQPDLAVTRGMRDRATGQPVTERTVFEVASLTKGLTAVTVLAAAEEGRWALDTPFAEVTGWPLGSGPEGAAATLEDLLGHRAGISPHEALWYFAESGLELREIVARLGKLPATPGGFRERFSYSNLGYAALALPFEVRLGESWSDYAARRVLEPLDMLDTSFGPLAAESDVAVGGWGPVAMARKDGGPTVAAGGMRTSIRDLARWLRFHLGLHPGGAKVLSAAARAAMQQSRGAIAEKNPILYQGIEAFTAAPGYGLGWFVGDAAGHAFVFHPAYIDGFSAMIALVPERGLGVAVLVNDNVSAAPGLATHRIVSRALGMLGEAALAAPLPRAPEPPAPGSATAAAPMMVVPQTLPAAWRGTYEHAAYGRIHLEVAATGPVIRHHGQSWPARLADERSGTVDLVMFGVPFPFPVSFDGARVTLPLAMDPRAEPVVFSAVDGP